MKATKVMPAPAAAQAKMQGLVIDADTRLKANLTLNERKEKDPKVKVDEEAARTWAALHLLIPENEKVTTDIYNGFRED